MLIFRSIGLAYDGVFRVERTRGRCILNLAHKCGSCGAKSAVLKKCTCGKVWYCDKECQTKAWKSGHKVCGKACDGCGKTSEVLKACVCGEVWYCGKECQGKDCKAGHKAVCRKE